MKKEQWVARVGNSGNISEPHLHIYCVDMNDKEDVLEVKPNIAGIGLNLNALYRWAKRKLGMRM